MTASQIEFPLAVAVCAWCKPKEQGAGSGSLSHGICLRHFKKMALEARGLPVKRPRRRSERQAQMQAEGVAGALSLPF